MSVAGDRSRADQDSDDRNLWSDASEDLADAFMKPKSLGSQRLISVAERLEFPEANSIKMIWIKESVSIVETRTRLIERQYSWTGTGVHGRPKVKVALDGQPVAARLHGPTWAEHKVSSYLIDLSRTASPGSEIRVRTEQVFIDEGGTFNPRLSLRNIHEYDFGLDVLFAQKPTEYAYVFSPLGAETEDVVHALELIPVAEPPYRYRLTHKPDPGLRGIHKLVWSF